MGVKTPKGRSVLLGSFFGLEIVLIALRFFISYILLLKFPEILRLRSRQGFMSFAATFFACIN